MTTQEKLQAIRQKCIEANPDIVSWKVGCRVVGMHGELLTLVGQREIGQPPLTDQDIRYPRAKGRITHVDVYARENGSRYEYMFSDDSRILGRPIRLADVLLTCGLTPKDFVIRVNTQGEFIFDVDIEREVQWNLRNDSLDDQSEETISFLYDLLL